MGLQTYVFILFGISLAFFFLGYKPMLFTLLQCGNQTCNLSENYAYNILNKVVESVVSNPLVLGIATIGVISGALLGGSFAVVYVIPIVIVLVLSNFVLLPTDFLLTATSLPFEIKLIVLGFMNLLLLMTIITFIRGGE